MDYILILEGVAGGLVYALSGLANKPAKERFDWKKLLPTLAVSAVVGGVAGFTGQDFGILINSAMAAGFTATVQKFWQAFTKKK